MSKDDTTSPEDFKLQFYGIVRDLQAKPIGYQLAAGLISGWLSGYTVRKVGRFLLVGIGGTVLILQAGFIHVNWNKSLEEIKKLKSFFSMEKESSVFSSVYTEVERFMANHSAISTSYLAGLLLGICV